MTDREMLELAAKASKTPIDYWNDGTEPYSSGEGFVLPNNAIWNPLRDDGDALRLAVKLQMQVTAYLFCSDASAFGKDNVREIADDGYIATRRAIVRAAAEVGKTIP